MKAKDAAQGLTSLEKAQKIVLDATPILGWRRFLYWMRWDGY